MGEQLQLEELLKQCTVRLAVPGTSLGTGFFVAPGLILTCAHVVKTAREKSLQVEAYLWDGTSIGIVSIQKFLLENIVVASPVKPVEYLYPDIALLQVEHKEHLCVYLDTHVHSGDIFYSFGYTGFYPQGDAARFTYVGESQIDSQKYLLQFQGGIASPGLSGAPLLNIRSGGVCGIVQKNRSLENTEGGRGIPINVTMKLPELKDMISEQQKFHQKDKRWRDHLTPEQRKMLGMDEDKAANDSNTIEIFFSYVEEDKDMAEKLQKHLILLKRQGLITNWHSGELIPEEEPSEQIKEHLDRAKIILLLISQDFMFSEHHDTVEVKRAMERHNSKEAIVIPILLRPSNDLDKAPFGALLALPRNRKPISKWSDKDEAFVEVARDIRAVVERLRSPNPR
jgi:hypothetical protein